MKCRTLKLKPSAKEAETIIITPDKDLNVESDAQMLAALLKRCIPDSVLIRCLEIMKNENQI